MTAAGGDHLVAHLGERGLEFSRYAGAKKVCRSCMWACSSVRASSVSRIDDRDCRNQVTVLGILGH